MAAAAVDQLGVAEHPAVLVELAQLRRVDLHEYPFRSYDFRIELDGHAAFAHDQARGGAHLAPAIADDVVDDGTTGHGCPALSAASRPSFPKAFRKVRSTPSSRATVR